jgi:hypothetical protein
MWEVEYICLLLRVHIKHILKFILNQFVQILKWVTPARFGD